MGRPLTIGKWRCPGVFLPVQIELCPKCGEEVEFFAGDVKLNCGRCGALVRRRSPSCLQRCPAKQSECYREMLAAGNDHDD